MSFLHHFILQHNQVHQNVTDGRHCIFGVHHLELGVVDDIKWFSHVCVILSFSLKGKVELRTKEIELEREAYLLVQPLLVTVKYRPVIGEVGVEDLLDLHVQQDLSGLLLHNEMAESREEKPQSVRSDLERSGPY